MLAWELATAVRETGPLLQVVVLETTGPHAAQERLEKTTRKRAERKNARRNTRRIDMMAPLLQNALTQMEESTTEMGRIKRGRGRVLVVWKRRRAVAKEFEEFRNPRIRGRWWPP